MATKLTDWFRGGGDGGARGGSVRVIVNSVYGGGEVRSSRNVNDNNDGRCGHRYREKGLGVSCGGESDRTGSEAAAAAEQRGSVGVVVDSVCGGGKVRLSENVDVYDDGRCGCKYGDKGLRDVLWWRGIPDWFIGVGGGGVDRVILCEASSVDGVVVVGGFVLLSSSCCRNLTAISLFVWFF